MEKYNKEEILKKDTFGLDAEIREVFPDAQIALSYWGHNTKAIQWLIGITPIETISVISDDRYNYELLIDKLTIYIPNDKYLGDSQLKHKSLFHGSIPPNDQMEPDMEFIKKILKNHRTIGTPS